MRRLKRRGMSLVLVGAMLTTMLITGCSGSDSPKGEEEKVKLRLMSISSDGNQTEILENYIKKNIEEALPNVEVEFEAGGSGADYDTKIKTYNASGDLPDVYYIEARTAPALISAGNILDMTEYIEEDGFIDNYTMPSALQHSDGNIYAITSGADTYFTPVVYYNKEVFEQYGLTIPQTYEELLEVCKTLKDNGQVPMALAGQGGWATQLFLIEQMIMVEDPQLAADILSNKADFSSETVVNAANRISEMQQAGYFPEGATNLAYSDAREMFSSGRAAMLAGWSWDIPIFETDANVDFFLWPSAKEGVDQSETIQYWGSPLNGYAVNPNSEHVEEAVKLAEFCVQMEATFYAEKGSKVNYNTGIEAEEVSDLMQKIIDTYDAADTKIASFTLNCMDTKVNSEFATYSSQLLLGDYTGEDFVADFNPIWQENTWFD